MRCSVCHRLGGGDDWRGFPIIVCSGGGQIYTESLLGAAPHLAAVVRITVRRAAALCAGGLRCEETLLSRQLPTGAGARTVRWAQEEISAGIMPADNNGAAFCRCYSICRSWLPGHTRNRLRKFLSDVVLASTLVTSFDAIFFLEVMLTFPLTLAPDRGLYEKGKPHTIWISNF